MRLKLPICCVAMALGAVSLAPRLAWAGAPVAQLRGYSCVRAVDPPMRGLSVTAVMRPVAGTHKLELRYDLLRAPRPGGRYREVHGRNLAHWLRPRDPTLGQHAGDVWQDYHPIVGLSAPAFYRLRVTFRWLGPNGAPLARTVRTPPICHQLELRPDLFISSISVTAPQPPRPGQDTYVAVVRNGGATGAGPFVVQLSTAGGTTSTTAVRWLPAHGVRSVRFTAAACTAGERVTVTADPTGQTDDYDRADNTRWVSCPASSSG